MEERSPTRADCTDLDWTCGIIACMWLHRCKNRKRGTYRRARVQELACAVGAFLRDECGKESDKNEEILLAKHAVEFVWVQIHASAIVFFPHRSCIKFTRRRAL